MREYPAFRDTLLPEPVEQNGTVDGDESDDSSISSYLFYRHQFGQHRRRGTAGTNTAFVSSEPQPPLSKDQRLTCSPFVPAFSLSARRWGLVLLRELEGVKWNNEVYDKLQIDSHVKQAVHTIVKSHSKKSTEFDDFIQGKGRGLVFLLHGPPGCGKTMTAGKYII